MFWPGTFCSQTQSFTPLSCTQTFIMFPGNRPCASTCYHTWCAPTCLTLLTLKSVRWVVSALGLPHSSVGKESACNARDPGSVPGLGRSPGERKGYPLQYSGLEKSMDCIVHGVTKSRTRPRDFHFHCVYWLYLECYISHFTSHQVFLSNFF